MQNVGWTAAVLLLLSACTRVPDRPLKVGTSPWAGSEPLYLARQLQQFPPRTIHLVEFTSENQLARAFRNGVIDAATVPLLEALRFEQMGQQPRVVLMLDASRGEDCLVARAGVDSLAALKGKRVAHTGGLAARYLLARLGERGGLRAEDLEEAVLSEAALEADFKRGRVDAVLTTPSRCARLHEGTDTHLLFEGVRQPDEFVDVLVVREEVLEKSPEQVDALLRGWFAALGHYQREPEQNARLMAPRLSLDTEDFQTFLAGLHLADVHEQRLYLMGARPRLQEKLERLSVMAVEKQLLSSRPDTTRLLDAAPLARVLP